MADQTILTSGINSLIEYIKSTYTYIAIGNGSWGGSEKIPLTRNTLKHEVYRTEVMSTNVEGNIITFYAAFTGTDIQDTVGDATVYNLTEIILVDRATESSSQKAMAMKVFNTVSLTALDSKVVKITVTLQYTNPTE